MREIALDTETTGLDPASGHRIVEIGCVEMMGRVRTGKVLQFYLNPERDMPQEAYAVHGLSNAFLADKPVFAQVAEKFLEFIGDTPLVIHNAQFDMRFINAELENAGFPTIPFARATDTVQMARKKFPGSPAKLDALCKRFNIDTSARTKHGALLDAELLADVYLELMGGRQETLMLAPESTPESIAAAAQQIAAVPYRSFPPSPEELAAHAAFLKNIKDAIWLKEETAA
jgi:DNA polymerase-3 subunit epsilon